MVTQCWRLGVQSERQTAGSCEGGIKGSARSGCENYVSQTQLLSEQISVRSVLSGGISKLLSPVSAGVQPATCWVSEAEEELSVLF